MTGPHPFLGWFAIRGLALATINLSNKFEVSISICYEDMKDNTKWWNLDDLGWWCAIFHTFCAIPQKWHMLISFCF